MIIAEHLAKSFGPLRAVNDVSLTVQPGEVLGFLGPNGAGKSTTMRLLTGFIPADAGTVTIGTCKLDDDPIGAKALIGYLPENAPAYGDMTVAGFLRFVGALRGLHGRALRAALERVLDTCFLQPVREQTIDTLSKGYKHRTCFAQALIHDPPVLVLDEPTDGLDPNQKHEMRNLIKAMGRTKAIILSTHILEEVDAVCSRVLIISGGQLVANGLPQELRARSQVAGAVTLVVHDQPMATVTARLQGAGLAGRVVALSEAPGRCTVRVHASGESQRAELAAGLARWCAAAGWVVSELHTEEGRLDEVFRAITLSEEQRP